MPNPLDNSIPFDVHKWSEYPQVKLVADELFDELRTGALAFKKLDTKKFKKHLRVLLINLYARVLVDPEGYIGYPRSDESYSSITRYNQLFIRYTPLINAIDALIKHGYIEDVKGFHDRVRKIGKQSRMRATSKLIGKFTGWSKDVIQRAAGTETIILRGKNAHDETCDVDYNDMDNSLIPAWRRFTQDYNALLENTYIDLAINSSELDLHQPVNLTEKFTRRIFSDGSFDKGGRFYGGWWQRLSKAYRPYIIINSEITAEIDFSGLHIYLLYLKQGVTPAMLDMADVYDLSSCGYPNDDKYRNLLKHMLLIIVNATDEAKAIKAIRYKVNKDKHEFPKPLPDLKKIYGDFRDKHKAISQYFCTNAGLSLQNIDSRIAERVLGDAMNQGVCVLSIHDSFICPYSYYSTLIDSMVRAYTKEARNIVSDKASMKEMIDVISPMKKKCRREDKLDGYVLTEEDRLFTGRDIRTSDDRRKIRRKLRNILKVEGIDKQVRTDTEQKLRERVWKDTRDSNFYIRLG